MTLALDIVNMANISDNIIAVNNNKLPSYSIFK